MVNNFVESETFVIQEDKIKKELKDENKTTNEALVDILYKKYVDLTKKDLKK